jgi:hypothetical protein
MQSGIMASSNPQEDIDIAKLRNTAEKALAFQRFIFRRAFGVIYAVWALVIAIDLIIPWVLQTLVGTPSWLWIAAPVVQALTGIGAGVVTAVTSAKAAKTIVLREAVDVGSFGSKRRRQLMMTYYVILFSVIAVTMVILKTGALTVVSIVLLAVTGVMFVQLRRIFSFDVPIEGKIVVAVFGGCTIASFVLSILTPSQFTEVPWVVMSLSWLFCALYALKMAPEEWVAGTD